jgi:hypothetical protein
MAKIAIQKKEHQKWHQKKQAKKALPTQKQN